LLQNVGGWAGWDGAVGAAGYVTDMQARSAPYSQNIEGSTDSVHLYSAAGGKWVYTAWQYIPTWRSGSPYFILMNSYDGSGQNYAWSVQVTFTAEGKVHNDWDADLTKDLDIVPDQWVELKVLIDLDNDTHTFYYNGVELYTGVWKRPGDTAARPTIAAVDLYANSATAIYYDDMSLVKDVPAQGTIAGKIDLLDWAADAGQVVKVILRDGSQNPRVQNVTLGAGGAYTIANVAPGTYNVAFEKMPHWLRKVKPGVIVPVGQSVAVNAELTNGDVTGDNKVDDFDLLAVSADFGGAPSGSDPTDITGDGIVDDFDLLVVSAIFGTVGDN
jgi:hypothetical protein